MKSKIVITISLVILVFLGTISIWTIGDYSTTQIFSDLTSQQVDGSSNLLEKLKIKERTNRAIYMLNGVVVCLLGGALIGIWQPEKKE